MIYERCQTSLKISGDSSSELTGAHEVMRSQFRKELHINDVYYNHYYGGGGYGDPLDRIPELVRKDVIDRRVGLESAKTIYGVIIDPDTFVIDERQTEQQRDSIREARRYSTKIKES